MDFILYIWNTIDRRCPRSCDRVEMILPLSAPSGIDCTLREESVRRIAAMLKLPEPPCECGDPIPLGWHFPLLGAMSPRCHRRVDGFAGLGFDLPEIDLPRLVAAGRRIEFGIPFNIGEALERDSQIIALDEKQTSSGKILVLTAEHRIRAAGSPHVSIAEQQTYVFLAGHYSAQVRDPWLSPSDARLLGRYTPDETLLFQFSALSFNPHRIHLDREYARETEGYPDLVVNGGITTLLMTEYARREFGITTGTFSVANKIPLFVNREITFMTRRTATGRSIVALDSDGALAAEMDIQTNGV
jgi:3-methylfumaryl-CoA hydratase